MNHPEIDGKGVAEAYLRHKLSSEDRAEFEAHLVDCEECRDRVLLAEMFQARNGLIKSDVIEAIPPEPPPERTSIREEASAPENPVEEQAPGRRVPPYLLETIEYEPKLPQRAKFVAWLKPWQIWVILIVAAAVLVLIPTAGILFTK